MAIHDEIGLTLVPGHARHAAGVAADQPYAGHASEHVRQACGVAPLDVLFRDVDPAALLAAFVELHHHTLPPLGLDGHARQSNGHRLQLDQYREGFACDELDDL